jgi:hypothetical protein
VSGGKGVRNLFFRGLAQRSSAFQFPMRYTALVMSVSRRLRCLQREEMPGEAQLYAQQSGQERLGTVSGGVALVEPQVLLSQ